MVLSAIAAAFICAPAAASYLPFNTNVNLNVGIGSVNPGQKLDVNGTVRSVGLIMSGQTPMSGYVLTASDTAGDITWTSPSNISAGGWTVTGSNLYATNTSGNVGIGTTIVNQAALTVMNGNVGIGTWSPRAQLDVEGTYSTTILDGNVGIGSTAPGADLAIYSTSGSNYAFRYDNGSLPYVTIGVYGSTNIRTNSASLTGGAYGGSLNIGANGSVGIAVREIGSGTNPLEILQNSVGTTVDLIDSNGNLGIGSSSPSNLLDVEGTSNATAVFFANSASTSYNVGIGSFAPGQKLDVTGTVRAVGLTMSGQTPMSGYVLTSVDTAGDMTWSNPATLSGGGWTVTGANIYATNTSGNVGIGTTIVNQAALTVMNGNVGIGTWAPAGALDVEGTLSKAFFAGNVGIGTMTSASPLTVFGNGNIVLNVKTSTSNAYIDLTDSGGTAEVSSGSGALYLGGAAANTIVLRNNNYAARMFVSSSGNIGIGSTFQNWTPVNRLNIMTEGNGGVGIGTGGSSPFITTSAPNGGMIVQSNVGIGSTNPGQALDVTGTIRTVGLTMSGQTPMSGYVLTSVDTAGDMTWSNPATLSGGGWTVTGANIYATNTSGNVGIGTTIVNQAALTVMNGNVGIGTWVPTGILQIGAGTGVVGYDLNVANNIRISNINSYPISLSVGGSGDFGVDAPSFSEGRFVVKNSSGNVGIGTSTPLAKFVVFSGNVGIGTFTAANNLSVLGGEGIGSTTYANTTAPPNGLIVQGDVGIGSVNPGQALDVTGTIRTVGLTMSGQTPMSGYVLTASDTNGDTTWTSPSNISAGGWTISGSNIYATNTSGNVGIGTTIVNQAALTVMNGNVGIGTWSPLDLLEINGTVNPFVVTSGGYVGIGTWALGTAFYLDVHGASRITSSLQVISLIDQAASQYYLDWGSGSHNGYSGESLAVAGNVGIGTIGPMGSLIVASGNVGIGSLVPGQALDVTGTIRDLGEIVNGNVGIGSNVPGQALDVNGTVRMTGFNISAGAGAGKVLTSDANGNGTWGTATGTNYWINTSGVGIGTYNNVGIGTTTPQGAFVVTNGNVGIGTIVPKAILDVEGTTSVAYFAGNVGIGILSPTASGLEIGSGVSGGQGSLKIDNSNGTSGSISKWTDRIEIESLNSISLSAGAVGANQIYVSTANVGIGTGNPRAGLDVEGTIFPIAFLANPTSSSLNVGIGSYAPGQKLDVTGTIRTVGLTMSGQTPMNGYVLTSVDTAGDMTWSNPATLSGGGWTVTGSNLYATNTTGNVGIGTTIVNQAALTVMNGNVGIGTWVPGSQLSVNGNAYITGNIGIGTTNVGGAGEGAFDIMNGNVGIGTWLPLAPFYVNTVVNNTGLPNGTGNSAFILRNGSGQVGNTADLDFSVFQTTNSPGAIIAAQRTTVAGGTDIYFLTNNGTGITPERMRITYTGNVGIGSTAPSGQLDVEGTQYPVVFNAATTASAFNVGIGSFAPGQKLDVQGTVRAIQFLGDGSQLTGISSNPWNDVTGVSQAMSVNNNYIADNASLVTLTLPAAASIGNVINVTGGVSGTGLWKIAQNAGQTIHFGSVSTTTGATGYLSATSQYDSVQLVCVKANTDFVVVSSQGNINYN